MARGGFRRVAPELPAAPITNQPEDAPGTALVAAAAQVPLEPIQVTRRMFKDTEWQQEAWRHFDICGEFAFVTRRHAAALSRCRYFMADVDEQGRPGKETKDKQVQALAETIFGDEASKAEAFRIAGINLYVAGECWIVAEGGTNAWYVVSVKELRKEASQVKVKRPETIGGGWKVLESGKDILMRCWTPHARLFDVADSPTRAVLPVLREIERLTMLTFSQIDSRLAIAGIMLLPDDIDFPHKQGQTPVQGLMEQVVEAAKQNLQGAGNAAGVVPIMVGVPRSPEGRASLANLIAHIKFDSPITPELEKKIDQALRRLALGLDVAPEELLGQGDANHWGAWQIEESSIKLFIDPAAARMCQALNQAYIKAALKQMGKDPDKFMLWYSTAPLVVRPNRQADAIQLSELDIIGNEAVRNAGDWDEDDKPSADELLQRRVWELCKLNPALIADKQIAAILGFPEGIQVPGGVGQQPPGTEGGDLPGGMDMGQPPTDMLSGNLQPIGGPPASAAGDSGAQQNALPQQPSGADQAQQAPKRPPRPKPERGLFASAQRDTDGTLHVAAPAAQLLVLTALERANKLQLTRANRGQYRDVPIVELHTRVRPATHEAARDLLDRSGAFEHASLVAAAAGVGADDLRYALRDYCAELLVRGYAHAPEFLQVYLDKVRPVGTP